MRDEHGRGRPGSPCDVFPINHPHRWAAPRSAAPSPRVATARRPLVGGGLAQSLLVVGVAREGGSWRAGCLLLCCLQMACLALAPRAPLLPVSMQRAGAAASARRTAPACPPPSAARR